MQYASILLVFLLSLVLGMGCAVEVERFQEGDLKVLYNGLHCLNADGEHGELVQRVQQVVRSPESMQVQSTNMDPVAKPTTMEGSGGQLNLEEFSGPWTMEIMNACITQRRCTFLPSPQQTSLWD